MSNKSVNRKLSRQFRSDRSYSDRNYVRARTVQVKQSRRVKQWVQENYGSTDNDDE